MADTAKKPMDLTGGSPGRGLFLFAIPMILGNLFQQFYNMVDTIIVGKFVGENALAAVGASYALTTVFVMIAIGGGTGACVITSQYLGARQYREMKTSVSMAVLSFLGASIILGLLGLSANRMILTALHTPDNILEDAALYLRIYFLGLPFLFMYNILSSVFNSLGDSRTSLVLLIFSSVLNIFLDLFTVRILQWGVAGVAVATVFAQGLAAVISFIILLYHLKAYEGKAEYFDPAILGRMVRVAIPSIIQQSIVSIGMLLVQSVVNGFGSSVLAGYTAGMRLESICIVPMISLGNAVSTFTAQNIGADNVERVKQGYRVSYWIVGAFAVIICAVLNLFKQPLIRMFLEEDGGMTAFQTGCSYLSFISWFFLFIGLKAVTDGVLRGAADVVVFTAANLVNLLIRVTVAFAFAPVIGVAAVWYAVPIGWSVNYLISVCRYLSGKWIKKKIVSDTIFDS